MLNINLIKMLTEINGCGVNPDQVNMEKQTIINDKIVVPPPGTYM